MYFHMYTLNKRQNHEIVMSGEQSLRRTAKKEKKITTGEEKIIMQYTMHVLVHNNNIVRLESMFVVQLMVPASGLYNIII